MAVIVLNMNIMHKINNSAVMDKSAKIPPLLIHKPLPASLKKKKLTIDENFTTF